MPFISERLMLTLWVGALWAIGYLAVPMAFATLGDVQLAGNYAGKLFKAVSILGIGVASVLLLGQFIQYKKSVVSLWRFWVLVLMLVLTLVLSCYLQPEIAAIKQISSLSEQFDLYHRISEWVYHLLSLLGLALVVSQNVGEKQHG